MPLELGYNTNGFAHHRLDDAIRILADLGYQSVAITLDNYALNPYSSELYSEVRSAKQLLQSHDMCCVIETGSRFLLDPARKHWPTLLTPDEDLRKRRFDFLNRAIEIAGLLDAEALSFWSGARDLRLTDEDAWSLLVDTCDALLTRAVQHDVYLAFEPEPGMFIERMDQFARLSEELSHARFGLTLDVGHLHCLNDGLPANRIREFGRQLFNVHIEDMKSSAHEHLMFGEGEIAFEPIFTALADARYSGTVNVELSRHSHDAVETARKAFEFLSNLNG
ncbi:MAG TPA: sugar phosphate isomerase/epimerase family protein [Phycisphaerae bacterium]|nr:sugar phosphate isomerase/epimerase family protein [Phycisphaerae bacterium]